MIEQSPELNELGKALAVAQAEIRVATKDATNPHFKSQYADLPAIVAASRPALIQNNIAVIQLPDCDTEKRQVSVSTMLLHSSGQWIRSSAAAVPKDLTPQSVGSAITYLRRYGLAAMVGVIADDDDDGNAAQPNANRPQAVKPITVPVKPPAQPATIEDAAAVLKRIAWELKFAANASEWRQFEFGLLGCTMSEASPAQLEMACDGIKNAALNPDIVRWNSESWACSKELQAYSIGLIIAHAKVDGFEKAKPLVGDPSKLLRLEQIHKMNANLLSWLDRPQLQQAA